MAIFSDKQEKEIMDRKILEGRLIDFSIGVIDLCQSCDFNEYTQHLSKQIVRSSSSCALNYGEAQSAESRADFTHKVNLVLKELRETYINLILIHKAGICRNCEKIEFLIKESDELVSIFQKTVNTLRKTNLGGK